MNLAEDLHLSSDSEDEVEIKTPVTQETASRSPPTTTMKPKVTFRTPMDRVLTDLRKDLDLLHKHQDRFTNVLPHLEEIHKRISTIINMALPSNSQ